MITLSEGPGLGAGTEFPSYPGGSLQPVWSRSGRRPRRANWARPTGSSREGTPWARRPSRRSPEKSTPGDAMSVTAWRTDSYKLRAAPPLRSEEHTSELQSRFELVCRLLLEKKKKHTEPSSRSESDPSHMSIME